MPMTASDDMRLGGAAAVQARVIGALIMRELHTRFGRHNIGYLWAIVEPMLLAAGVTAMHLQYGIRLSYGMDAAAFWVTGYTPWVMFRSIILRADGAIEGNSGLLYHRVVTLLDVMIARTLLEAAATTFALALLLAAVAALGLGHLPDRPLLMLAGMGLAVWLGFGLAMLVCAGCELSMVVQRLIHPIMYLMLPFSVVFFLIEWIPAAFRPYLLLSPTIHIIEMIREGQFGGYNTPYIDPLYVVGWCAATTLLGLLALRAVRPRLHLE